MSLRLIVTYGRPFKINSEQDRAMSGIQTALLALCNAFGRLGHEVHLFAECRDPGLHDGVHFHGRG